MAKSLYAMNGSTYNKKKNAKNTNCGLLLQLDGRDVLLAVSKTNTLVSEVKSGGHRYFAARPKRSERKVVVEL